MRSLPSVAAIVLLAGCSPPLSDAYVVELDPAFTPIEFDRVQSAVGDWRTKAGVSFTEEIGTCDGREAFTICVHRSTEAEVEGLSGVGPVNGLTRGPYPSGSSDVWLAVDGDNFDALPHIATHELGHALGLHHTGPGTVMCWSSDCASLGVTDEDVAQYRGLR